MLHGEARRHRPDVKLRTEQVPLQSAVNQLCADALCASRSTPLWDTSAMDGYALSSKATKNASADNLILFPVRGVIAAGREPVSRATPVIVSTTSGVYSMTIFSSSYSPTVCVEAYSLLTQLFLNRRCCSPFNNARLADTLGRRWIVACFAVSDSIDRPQ